MSQEHASASNNNWMTCLILLLFYLIILLHINIYYGHFNGFFLAVSLFANCLEYTVHFVPLTCPT